MHVTVHMYILDVGIIFTYEGMTAQRQHMQRQVFFLPFLTYTSRLATCKC
jgi:hypothetical protein